MYDNDLPVKRSDKPAENGLSGAYEFRNHLWALAHMIEDSNTHLHTYNLGRDEWISLLEGLGNVLADAMKVGKVDLAAVLETLERNTGQPILCRCEVCDGNTIPYPIDPIEPTLAGIPT